MRNFSGKTIEEIKTHLMFNNFFGGDRAVFEIMWKNILERARHQMTIWRMRIACWILKATNTHLEYVILIAFSLRQYLHQQASMLPHKHIASLVTL
jgi:hypothetical protein